MIPQYKKVRRWQNAVGGLFFISIPDGPVMQEPHKQHST